MRKFLNITGKLVLSLIAGLVLAGSLPAGVEASNGDPMDLELGGEGATPWNLSNIQPAGSGTKTVELRNIGSKDGFVAIWLSDIVSSEGVNPESETGDITEPGEFADLLLLDLTVDGLSTNIDLPTVVITFHRALTGWNISK